MAGLIVAGVITLVSLITNYFVPERFRWRKIALLTIGILGVIWSFAQGYMSYQKWLLPLLPVTQDLVWGR